MLVVDGGHVRRAPALGMAIREPIVAPRRPRGGARAPVALELIAGRGHYERVIRAVLDAHTSVWIATANVKELMVEDGRAAPGRRRSLRRPSYVSVLAVLDELAARGVELRLLHAELPSRPFRAELAHHPRLVGGGLALRRCPRVHLKTVIVDGELLYLGSANWTGAGLGAQGQRAPQLRARDRHRRRAAARPGAGDVRADLDRRRVRGLQAARGVPGAARGAARRAIRDPDSKTARPAPAPAACPGADRSRAVRTPDTAPVEAALTRTVPGRITTTVAFACTSTITGPIHDHDHVGDHASLRDLSVANSAIDA